MRKITQNAANAFIAGRPFKSSNTEVTECNGLVTILLYGNEIANKVKGHTYISHQGWQTATTKERLNRLPGVRINQQKGQWYLNGEPWNGEWIKINS